MRKNKSEQRGTLLIEAIAMLGLIAMVTPTLYKKSAERLQEIQDINIASQARMMNGIIETFVNNHKSEFVVSNGESAVYELFKEDNQNPGNGFKTLVAGYSSVIPAGFVPNELKYFGDPRVFVISDAETHNLVFYVVYPRASDIGSRRTAKLASLIGSNGGIVRENGVAIGVGEAWGIDDTIIQNYNMPDSFKELLTENTLVMTNAETISTKQEENDNYLWRVPGGTTASDHIHNTMITDLYLGGNGASETESDNLNRSKEYYSIFNVRKLSMNTRCSANDIMGNGSSNASCEDFKKQVADLYIGKPENLFKEHPTDGAVQGAESTRNYNANTGAAWIYGNLSALSERFKLYNTDSSSVERRGYDVLEFAREEVEDDANPTNNVSGLEVLKATNETNRAEVRFMNGFARVLENGTYGSSDTAIEEAFLVGGDVDSSQVEGRHIAAFNIGSKSIVMLNDRGDSSETYINRNGGVVHINGADSSEAGSTYINEEGGYLIAGKEGNWLRAEGVGESTRVMMLYDASSAVNGSFSLAGEDIGSSAVWANSQMISLQDGAIRAYKVNPTFINEGGSAVVGKYENGLEDDAKLGADLTNGTVLASKYTDILGSTYLGHKESMSAKLDDSSYTRADWQLGVAGSAWVDELLFANEAWFNSSGFKELHAGFSSYADYKADARQGWLNAYEDGVSIGNRVRSDGNSSGVGGVRAPDTRFFADDKQVYLGDSDGAMAYFKDGMARLGYAKEHSSMLPEPTNYVGADSSGAFVVGESLAEIYTADKAAGDMVDIQKGAMLFTGHSWNDSTKTGHDYNANTIETHASSFAVYTKDERASSIDNKAQFLVNNSSALVQYVDFTVNDDDNKPRFLVRSDESRWGNDSSLAHVMVDGDFLVTGNKVMHVASHSSNAAGTTGNEHAMFEIDPMSIKVMAMNGVDNVDNSSVVLKINPFDLNGESSTVDATQNASIYIRKGAIELMSNEEGASWAADEGYGYIKADRLVDTRKEAPYWGTSTDDSKYDQYMVNPAYTSVMHDIKLTTRGGARLSDILPDYILKGVYIVANDFVEGRANRIAWSAGGSNGYYCKNADKIIGGAPCLNVAAKWADPYVGVVPFAVCPYGYKNMATITPTSFQMGQAGDIVSSDSYYNGGAKGKLVVNPNPRQVDILNLGNRDIVYPSYDEVKMLEVDQFDPSMGGDFQQSKTAGWFLGFEASYTQDNGGNLVSKMSSSGVGVQQYAQDGNTYKTVAEPLYFQQNTFLKTALQLSSTKKGWDGFMGFLYNMDEKGYNTSAMGSGLGRFTEQTNDDEGNVALDSDLKLYWNVFPVPTNSIEGYAHVYCYFDRRQFLGDNLDGAGDRAKWKDVIDPIDQLRSDFHIDDKNKNNNPEYLKRLNDPSLKYDDPW